MPLYRMLERLSFDDGTKIEMGTVDPLNGVSSEVLNLLLAKRRIVEVKAPPLRALPGWKAKAEMLEPLGIEDVSQLVTADLEEIAEALDTPVEGLREAAQDAQRWITDEEEYDGKDK